MRNFIVSIVCAATLVGCSTTSETFYKNPKKVGDTSLCRTYLETKDYDFKRDIRRELSSRAILASSCAQRVRKQNNQIAAGVAVAAVGAAVIYCTRGGRSCGGGGSYGADWDQFYNDRYQLVWACREIQTGRFTEVENCSNKYQTDNRWPSKRAL